MPLTLASLVQHSALKLSVRAGEGRLDTPVRWAHVSELADPVPYMEGGELLLITAMKLDADDPEEMRRYVRRLAAAGVVGIGFAVGVNYDAVPEALVEAATAEDLPLLEVPRRTPFLAISKAVSAALAADQYRAVTAGFEAQRELTRAALSADGPAELLTKLAAHVHGWAALYDTSGAVVAAAPDWAARRAARLTPDVERLRERPAPASAVVGGSEDRVELQSLGTGRRARGALAVGTGAPLGTAERYAVHSAVALLTLTTERSRSLHDAESRLGAAVLRMLLAGQAEHAQAVAGDLYGALLDAPFRILVAEPALAGTAQPEGLALLADAVESAAARTGRACWWCRSPGGSWSWRPTGARRSRRARNTRRSWNPGAAGSRPNRSRTSWSSACRRPRWPPAWRRPSNRPTKPWPWPGGAAAPWSNTRTWRRARSSRCSPTTRYGPSRTARCGRCASTTRRAGATWWPPSRPGSPATASGTRPPPTWASTATPCATACGGSRRSSAAPWTTRTSAWSSGSL